MNQHKTKGRLQRWYSTNLWSASNISRGCPIRVDVSFNDYSSADIV